MDAEAQAVIDLLDRRRQLALERRDATLFLLGRALSGRGRMRGDGQEGREKPFTQLKSLLHEDWWMQVLPNSVCTGSTDMQFDFSPQSPQPSQTRSLMTVTSTGSSALPRLRARRSSAAHSGHAAARCSQGGSGARAAPPRCGRGARPGAAGRLYAVEARGSSVVTMIFDAVGRSETMLVTGTSPWIGLAAGHRGVRVAQQRR